MKNYLISREDINEYLKSKDKVFVKIIDDCKEVKIKLTNDYFIALADSIIGQQLSGKVADVISKRVHLLCNDNLTPKTILEIPDESLRAAGLSFAKIEYIKNLALAIETKKVTFDNINNMTDEEIITMLTTVKGIGRWTAEMFLIFALGREDVFSTGDGGLQRAVMNLYNIEKVTKKNLNELSINWQPYRTFASLYLWEMLNKKLI